MDNGYTINVLDKGYVKYVDSMGNDLSPIESARMSTDNPTGVDELKDDKLREFLWKNGHCYHADMQVLTSSGWKYWKDCSTEEEFLVPNPKTRTIKPEKLKVLKYEYNEKLIVFENNRMSFKVTPNHKMWFQHARNSEYSFYSASNMPQWGHFDPFLGYSMYDDGKVITSFFQLVGFYLGDGYKYSTNKIGFRLKKTRKINYLTNILNDLELTYDLKVLEGVTQITFCPPQDLLYYVDLDTKAHTKKFLGKLDELFCDQLWGLYDGLINSDGSIKKDRPQIEYSSVSENLLKLFETLSCYFGYDAHRRGENKVIAYTGYRTSLEARGQYFKSQESYNGFVYCTTTSTGLLVVRGKQSDFAFICGNSSPFESLVLTVEMKLPIFVLREFDRHRTIDVDNTIIDTQHDFRKHNSRNEFSGRYAEMPQEYYLPSRERLQLQSGINKQGSENELSESFKNIVLDDFQNSAERVYTDYKDALGFGLAREIARINLPLSQYTKVRISANFVNWAKMLKLRLDEAAQWEIRQYAHAIANIIKELWPKTYKVFEKYSIDAVVFTKDEAKMLHIFMADILIRNVDDIERIKGFVKDNLGEAGSKLFFKKIGYSI